MKTNDAEAILTRLGEKGILNKSVLKEINKDILDFLKDHIDEAENLKVDV